MAADHLEIGMDPATEETLDLLPERPSPHEQYSRWFLIQKIFILAPDKRYTGSNAVGGTDVLPSECML